MMIVGAVIGFFGLLFFILMLSYKTIIFLCRPNEVLIFSGSRRSSGSKLLPYRIIKGGRGLRKPFFERVDKIDLTNMIIELEARHAYTKGGIPIHVQGVANVKIAGHEPMLNNAIERFLGKPRNEIMGIAKATLEGSLRGVLATMTPEQLNEDRNLFSERLVAEVEQDMTALGLVVDTLKIQNIWDDVRYLDSIGRIRNAELLSGARIAEAIAQADASVRSSENHQAEIEAQIKARITMAQADADKRLADALSKRAALIAEEQAAVAAQVAKAKAELDVQRARIEQIRKQLEADVIQPAKANCESAEQAAKARVAPIIEEGKARAEALRTLASSWVAAGDQAREIFLLQKLEPVIKQITQTIGETSIERVTVVDTQSGSGNFDPKRLIALNEQVKELFGVDLVEKAQLLGGNGKSEPIPAKSQEVPAAPPPPPAG
ncbi:SPFH domain-containing protein [Kamptonema cortianum]|nr:SPFH domain-containing protein [Geitlerinema splendidum]MDK3158607.1 SPFH domain-containing protein [Kamptonema cortianum]